MGDRLRLMAIVLLGGTLTLLATGSLRQAEGLRLREHRRAATEGVAQAFNQELTRTLEGIRTAALMMEAHPETSRAQFNGYMRRLVQDQLSINVVEWQPIVAAKDLPAFEAAARAEGLADFQVVEPDPSGQGFRPVRGRDPYVVVRYAWPESYRTIGYDMSFSPERMASKLRSTETGTPTASGAFDFMKEGQVRSGTAAIAISTTVFDPDHHPRGYLAAVVDLPTLFQHAAQRARDAGLDLRVRPDTPAGGPPVFANDGATSGPPDADAAADADAQDLARDVDLAGQRWHLALRPHPGFYDRVPAQTWPWALAAGTAMTALLAWAVHLVQAGRRRVEQAEQAATSANRSLRIQSDRLLEAQRIAHLGSWQADLAAGTLAWSPELRQILGLPPEGGPDDLAHQHTLFADESWDRFQTALHDAPNTGDAFEVELELAGARGWLLAHGVAAEDGGLAPGQVHGVAMDITTRKEAELEAESLAFIDPLTGLPNRRLLLDRVGRALAFAERHHVHGALLFVDLDGFKKINDTFGHERGDQLLREVASRLTAAVRKGDTVGRLGGDEFVVLLEELGDSPTEAATHAELAARKLLDVLDRPHVHDAELHDCAGSIGLSLFGPEAMAPEELLRRADVAMYRAKAAGRRTLCFYDDSMQAAILARARAERDLREAVRSRWLQLHYQPQVDAAGRVTGVEALMRLAPPGRALVQPQAFIPLAEETGLIHELGAWVLDAAADQLAAWSARGDRAMLTVSVNVSPRQFRSPGFVPGLEARLARHRFPPERLMLELTEGLLLDDVDDAIGKMQRIVALGVRLALDDFGVGFSSLNFLRRLPLHQLKIDKCFVDDLPTSADDAAIVRMIVALADSLGLEAIAEGIERPEQHAHLARTGCRVFQGYLFGDPMPVDALEAMLDGAAARAGAAPRSLAR